jgi:phytoene dehydrogenase-like protein
MPDAIVIGAGPNGLVAANRLADAGWEVTVVEEQDEPGGTVRSAELVEPGFVSDLLSAFYPLAVASPAIARLELEQHGLRWCRSRTALAHPSADGTCAVLSTDLEATMASLESFGSGDGEAWARLYSLWERIGDEVIGMVMSPMPPVRPAARLAIELGPSGLLRLARFGTLGVRRLAEEEFTGPAGGLLLAGNALHADLMPEMSPSALYGWLLTSLGQAVGFPTPEGGAGRLTEALVRRLRARGGELVCGMRAREVLIRRGRAVGVELDGGERLAARRAVLADVDAPQLYEELVREPALGARIRDDLRRFQFDSATVKVDWTLDAPIPWSAAEARGAGTVHVADDLDALTRYATDLVTGRIPAEPFMVLGQYAPVDRSRMPDGKEVAWAYAHVPQRPVGDAGRDGLTGTWDERETEAFVARMEERVERLAPGFRSSIRARHVLAPPDFDAIDRNLPNGAINGGTAQLHQQLVLRPIPGLGRAETPIRRLFLCSASIHPGGGVHGACGEAGARAALLRDRGERARIALGGAAAAATLAAIARGRR